MNDRLTHTMLAIRKEVTDGFPGAPRVYYLRKAGGMGEWSPDLQHALLFETEDDTPTIRLHHRYRGTRFSLVQVEVTEKVTETRRELAR